MKTATLIKDNLPGFRGHAAHYRLSVPLSPYFWADEEDGDAECAFNDVVVSAVDAMFSGPETYIFGANKNGTITNWIELPGSFKGSWDHIEALRRAGYGVEPARGPDA